MRLLVGSLAALAAGVALGHAMLPADLSTLAPCTSEDQVTACRWDAATQGNGEGRSFLVLPDGTVVPEGPLWA
jgi:hypothetical protein